MPDWPFDDPPDRVSISVRSITDEGAPILLVSHDEEDGCWQFHDGSDAPDPEDGVVVSLESIFELDPSVADLADLPPGWIAWRETPGEPWERAERPEEWNEQ